MSARENTFWLIVRANWTLAERRELRRVFARRYLRGCT